MNAYRSYFDRINVSNTLHQRLLSGERAEQRRAPALVRYGSMAACFALICLAGWGIWWVNTPHVGGDITAGDSLIPGEKDTYGPGETPPVLAGDEYVLSPAETLYTPTKVTPVNFEGGTELAASIAMPEGWFEEKLTRAQMVTLLGGEEKNDAPWYLMWSGYNITGKAIYDGTGKLWRVALEGVERADDKNSFSMTLRPGALPEDCVVENKEATVVNGVSVGGSKGQYGWDDSGEMGEVRKLTFMAGDVGVSYQAYHRSGEQAEVLASRAAQCYAGRPDTETLFTLSLDGLDPYEGEIPAWRSEKLTLAEARAEEGFGKYVPTWVPEGFAFESASRELGQGRDWLSVYWSGYYTNISVTISHPFEEIEVMDVENRAYYDERLYTIPYADSVPDEVMFGGFQDPIFRFEDLTLDVLAARLTLATGDAGDIDNYGGNFSVLYSDGLVARYSFKGVSPEEAVKLLGVSETPPGTAQDRPEWEEGENGLRIRFPGAAAWTDLSTLVPVPKAWATQDLDGRNRAKDMVECGLGMSSKMGFITSTDGWLVFCFHTNPGPMDDTYFYRTYDGGHTWEEISHFTSADFSKSIGPWFGVNCAAFADENRGYLCMGLFSGAPVFRTDDGGKSWQLYELPLPKGEEKGYGATSLSFRDGKGVMQGDTYTPGGTESSAWTLYSDDNGDSWQVGDLITNG